MSAVSDPELLAFSTELIERRGGLAEPQSGGVMAVLPHDVARELELPDEVLMGSEQMPLLYGSPLLDRLIAFATRDIPVVYGQIQSTYLKKGGFEQLIGPDISFADGQVRVGARAEARTTYMVLTCHYVALSDERKEGLVQAGVHESSGALVPEFAELWEDCRPQFFEAGKVPPHFPAHLEQAMASGMKSAETLVAENLSDFLCSMQRHLRRDVKNTIEYYEALGSEMKSGLAHSNLTDVQRQDRLTKISELPEEKARKIRDLEEKYQVRVTVSACAALRLLVDIVQLTLELRFRKLHRSVRVIWNPVTRSLDPLVCERCHATLRRIHPVAGDSTIQLLCPSCSRKKGLT
jgi:hypothetical protein